MVGACDDTSVLSPVVEEDGWIGGGCASVDGVLADGTDVGIVSVCCFHAFELGS